MYVRRKNLIDCGRNLGQVLVDAGHGELDLVTHTLRWTFRCVCCCDEEEEDPEGARTEPGEHLAERDVLLQQRVNDE